MTTATSTNPKAKLEEAEKQLAEACRNRAKRGEEYSAWDARPSTRRRGAQLIAATDPDQFDGAGQRSRRAGQRNLAEKLDQDGSSRWPQILEAADRQVVAAEGEAKRGSPRT